MASCPGGGAETSLGAPSLNKGRGASSARPQLIRELLGQELGGGAACTQIPQPDRVAARRTRSRPRSLEQAMNSKNYRNLGARGEQCNEGNKIGGELGCCRVVRKV